MRTLSIYLLAVIFCIATFVTVFLTCIEVVAFNKENYRTQYEILERDKALETSQADLMKVTDQLIAYIQGKKTNLEVTTTISDQDQQFFNDREKAHMIDVRNLFVLGEDVRTLALVICLFALILIFFFEEFKGIMLITKTMLWCIMVFIIMVIGLTIWAKVDFSGFWNGFHLLSFSNDLWQLDPDTDRMIVLFPLEFFIAFVRKIITFVIISTLIIILLSAIIHFLCKRILNRPKYIFPKP